MESLRVLDLFSGIGGFSLGLERAGMKTVAFCEIDSQARKVLNKHWLGVPVFEDVKKLKAKHLNNIDVICGGFPCQDISVAGKKKGLKGERSGLWREFKRLIKEIKPRYAIIENVANLRSNGLQEILKDLWQIGYASEWHIISARSIGAPHLRERIWIIAYPNNFRLWKPFASEKEKSQWWSEATSSVSHWKEAQSIVCGVDDGVSRGVDRLRRERIKQLGNSVVPQIPELIGRAILDYEMSIYK
jgi:DNA (cytosine-5)-methyltransferase 1